MSVDDFQPGRHLRGRIEHTLLIYILGANPTQTQSGSSFIYIGQII